MPDLSDSGNWSEIDALNNNAPPNGWPEGMMPSGVNDAARADRGAMKRFWDRVNPVQAITPSGGVYTFTTANPAYPTAYVAGEIYCFRPTAASVGSDQFQVNGIFPKPILKRIGPGAGSFTPIIAQDITAGLAAQLIYDATLNTGAGVFVLLNPFVPISGDGAGGVSVPGGLTVAGDLAMTGSVTANGDMSINGDLQVTGALSVTGYKSRSGTGGPYQTNLWNIQWAGADGAHLWIDTTDQGPIVTAPGGNIVIGGSIGAALLSVSGNISAGTLSVSGNVTVTGTSSTLTAPYTLIGNEHVTGPIQVDGHAGFSGDMQVNGNLTCGGDISGHTLYASGGISVTNGGVNIVGGLYVVGTTTLTSATTTLTILPAANNVHSLGVVGTAWYAVNAYSYPSQSDPTLKRDIEPVPAGCLDLVRAIEPRTYKWAKPHEDDAGKTHWGFLAPEVRDVIEGAGHKFGAVREENGLSSLDYNEMTVVLWAAVRELAERLERK